MASVSSFGVSEHHISAPWTILDPLGPKNVALSPFFLFFPKKGSENLYKYGSRVSVDEMVSNFLCWLVFYSFPGFYFNLPSKKFHKMAFDANMQMRLRYFFWSPPIFIVIFDPCRGQIKIFEASGDKI